MRTEKGQFVKGERAHPETEFKPGQHWRTPKSHWNKAWLEEQYLTLGRSARDIGAKEGCGEAGILYWLHKHGIPRRTISEARKIKKWGVNGSKNGMYGKRGLEVPSWRGGITPERQAFYSNPEWLAAAKYVRQLAKNKCRRCGAKPHGCAHHIHHRVTFVVREVRIVLDNLVLLCPNCHRWVHSKKNIRGEYLGKFQMSMKGGDLTSGEHTTSARTRS